MKAINFFLINLICILLTGCSDNNNDDNFLFVYKNTDIALDESVDNVLVNLGETTDYYEADSCTFDGTGKLYSYNGFDISTYQKSGEDEDRIYSIDIWDAGVSTSEGISIGQTFEDMVSVYGKDYEETEGLKGFYQYIKNNTVLSFNFRDDVIDSISYKIANIYTE